MHYLNRFYIPLLLFLPFLTTGQADPEFTNPEIIYGSAILSSMGTTYFKPSETKDSEEKPFHIEAVYETSQCASNLESIEVNNAHFPLTWYELDESGHRVHTLFNPQLNHFNNQTTYVVVDVSQHTDTIFIDFSQSLSVQKIFPNPHTGSLFIDYSAMDQTPLELHIVDISGKNIFKDNTILNPGENQLTLHLNHLQEGIYFLSLKGLCINEFKKIVHLK